MVELVLVTVVGATILTGAAFDAATLTIPNWISAALIAVFPVLAVSAGLPLGEAATHLAVGLGALAIGISLFAAGLIGGGDAKLFAAVALYMGAGWVAPYLLAVATAGGVLAVAVLALRWVARRGLVARMPRLGHLLDSRLGIPYGVAIAAGGFFVFPTTHLFALATGAP